MKKDRIEFILKRPGKHRRVTFSIIKKTIKPGKKPEHKAVISSALNAINSIYKNKVQDFNTCEFQAKEIVEKLYKEVRGQERKPVFLEENLKVLEHYWSKEYSHRDLVDENAAKNEFKRALKAIGNLSIVSASKEELQKVIKNRDSGNTKLRRITKSLNILLKFLNRDFKLIRPKKEFKPVKYLTLDEFKLALGHIEDPNIRLLCWVGFCTGMRFGEIFAVTLNSFSSDKSLVYIKYQVDKDGVIRATKNRKDRKAAIIPEGIGKIDEWLRIDQSQRDHLRKIKISEIVVKACLTAFPNRNDKVCVFHDLRHSYAIHLLQQKIPLDWVAKFLGNSPQVCNEYYLGYSPTDEIVEAANNLLRRA